MPRARQIYVAVMNGGPDAWRAIDGEAKGGDVYEIVSVNDDPQVKWEYETGELVRCRSTTLPSGERVLVATQRVRRESGYHGL